MNKTSSPTQFPALATSMEQSLLSKLSLSLSDKPFLLEGPPILVDNSISISWDLQGFFHIVS